MPDINTDSSTPEYTMGYTDEFRQLLERRGAETHAAHLLPYLKRGMSVLDFGCGPGMISLGLAKAVEPGELHGIDIKESQVEMARAAAAAGGHRNATFHVGDVTALPFENDSFDVAHCSAVLTHVPDTQAVLAEVRRVLKPGGIISCREFIADSSFFEPELGNLNRVYPIFRDRIQTNSGHPQMGIELKGAFVEAGFSDVHASASFETFGNSSDVEFWHGYIMNYFLSPTEVQADITQGRSTQKAADEMRRSLGDWKNHPGAFASMAWGEAIARKP